MRLILHCGIHRTGSTSIQRTLNANVEKLREHGYLYPYLQLPNHGKIAWYLHLGRLSGQELLQQIKEQCSANIHSVILSSEDFSVHTNLDWIRPILDAFDVKAFFYFRRQDKWLTSWYNQHIRWPFNEKLSVCTPKQFLEHVDDFYWIKYDVLLQRFSKEIKRENISIRIMEQGSVEDSVSDFVESAGLVEVGMEQVKSFSNNSIGGQKLQILRQIELFDYSPKQRKKIISIIQSLKLLSGNDDNKEVFPVKERESIINRFYESNKYVAQEYLNRRNGILFSETSLGEEPPPDLTPHQMIIIMKRIIKKIMANDQ